MYGPLKTIPALDIGNESRTLLASCCARSHDDKGPVSDSVANGIPLEEEEVGAR